MNIPQTTPQHPASPQAASAPAADPADVLRVDTDNLPHMPPEMQQTPMHMNHNRSKSSK